VTLAERLLELHHRLRDGRLPHAFGGAIALAYWTLEPRGTRDLDVNVFVPVARSAEVLRALPAEIAASREQVEALDRDGQVRLWWDDTPVDLFLDYAPIHEDAARGVRTVPFEGEQIPVLGPVELAVFKAMFDRTKDWADIEAILAAGSATREQIESALRPMLAGDDARWSRLARA
jgi:hypothetical protein